MKRKFRKASTKEGQTISWTHTATQAALMRLYLDDNHGPKLGVSKANGHLLLGEPKRVAEGKFERSVVENAPFTLYNIADHLGYTLTRTRFTNQVIGARIGIPDDIVHDMSNGAKQACYRDVQRLRLYFMTLGFSGIQCYLYFCYKLQLNIDEGDGKAAFIRSPDQYLTLIPISPAKAQAKFPMSGDELFEMALSVAFIMKRRLRHRNLDATEQRMLYGVKEMGIEGMLDWKRYLNPLSLSTILKDRDPDDEDELYLE